VLRYGQNFFSREILKVNASLALKQERFARLTILIEEAIVEKESLEREIVVDTEELTSRDPKVIWRRAFGTPLTYQALCDFFLTASPHVSETAARQLYTFARSRQHQYAYWALRFWPYWTKSERVWLLGMVLLSQDTDAYISVSKVLLLDELWGRTMYHLGHGCTGRMGCIHRLAQLSDIHGLQYVRNMQQWTKAPLLPQELDVLQSKIATYTK
jgi:hypothetical protein